MRAVPAPERHSQRRLRRRQDDQSIGGGGEAMANVSRPDEPAALADLLALAPAADRARLAGVGAARPLMTARAVQLAREAVYARARLGEDDPRTRGVAAKAQLQS